jgi:hypothetical protein
MGSGSSAKFQPGFPDINRYISNLMGQISRVLLCSVIILVLLFTDCAQRRKSEQDSGLTKRGQQAHLKACPRGCTACQQAIKRALEFLISKQDRDGAWNERHRAKEGDMLVNFAWPVATTSLVCLSLIAHGDLEDSRLKVSIKKGLKYILGQAKKSGAIFKKDRLTAPRALWQTALAVIFLSEMFSRTREIKIKQRIQKAIKFFGRRQLRGKGGGWDGGYGHTRSHIGITYTILAGLLCARSAGIDVPDSLIQSGLRCLLFSLAEDGSLPYEVPEVKDKRVRSFVNGFYPQELVRTGAALYVIFKGGNHKNGKVTKMTEFMVKHRGKIFEQIGSKLYIQDLHFCHALLFTLLFQRSYTKEWDKWYIKLRDILLETQDKKTGGWGIISGDTIFYTALNLLILQLPLDNLRTLY